MIVSIEVNKWYLVFIPIENYFTETPTCGKLEKATGPASSPSPCSSSVSEYVII